MKFITLLMGTLLCCGAWANILIIQSSDNHSKYGRIANFIQSSEILIRKFKEKDPTGEVIFLFNGDYSGASAWTMDDHGQLGYELLGKIAQKYKVLFTFGNHEAFDWGDKAAKEKIFERQMRFLKKQGVVLLAANVKPQQNMQNLFVPFYDYNTTFDKKLRFLGFTLESMDKMITPLNMRHHFLQIEPYDVAGKRELDRARHDGVEKLVIAYHDDYQAVINSIENFSGMKGDMDISIAFAAHDHKKFYTYTQETLIADSLSSYDFSAVELDNEAKVLEWNYFGKNEQRELITKFPEYIGKKFFRKILTFIEARTKEIKQINNKSLAKIPLIPENKWSLKKGPKVLGSSLAEANRRWAIDNLNAQAINFEPAQVISIFNSSSYRLDDYLEAGDLTLENIKDIMPMQNDAHIFKMTGAEIRTIYFSLREKREAKEVFSPQSSFNVREGEDRLLEVLNADKKWHPIDAEKEYFFVMDHWNAINGYHIDEFVEILADQVDYGAQDQFTIFRRYLPPILSLYNKLKPADRHCDDLMNSILLSPSH